MHRVICGGPNPEKRPDCMKSEETDPPPPREWHPGAGDSAPWRCDRGCRESRSSRRREPRRQRRGWRVRNSLESPWRLIKDEAVAPDEIPNGYLLEKCFH